MQNLSLVASLVLEIWRHIISLSRREQVIEFGYSPREVGLSLKMRFYVQNRSFRPKIWSLMSILAIFKQNKIKNFWDVSMRKEHLQGPGIPISLEFGQSMS